MKKQKAHAKYSPSAAERWLSCPGSIALSEKAPPPPESDAAIQGTLAHECLELIIKNGPHKRLQTVNFLRKKHALQSVFHADQAAGYIWGMVPKHAELLSETKAEISHIHPDFYGTADAVIIEPFGLLTVIDFKYGLKPVEVEENAQLISYTIGIAKKYHYNFALFRNVIIQPRANHESGPVRSHMFNYETLKTWEKKFETGIKETKAKKPRLRAGSHCLFCPAKTICKEYELNSDEANRAVRSSFMVKSEKQKFNQAQTDFDDESCEALETF